MGSRFPPARIKKIMQTDEEIGKVAAAVPVVISKCIELFIVGLLKKTGEVTSSRKAKAVSTSHLKECIQKEKTYDFLTSLVENEPDCEPPPTAAAANSDDDYKEPQVKEGGGGSKEKVKRKRSTTSVRGPYKRHKSSSDCGVNISSTSQLSIDRDAIKLNVKEEAPGCQPSTSDSFGSFSPSSAPEVKTKTREKFGARLPKKYTAAVAAASTAKAAAKEKAAVAEAERKAEAERRAAAVAGAWEEKKSSSAASRRHTFTSQNSAPNSNFKDEAIDLSMPKMKASARLPPPQQQPINLTGTSFTKTCDDQHLAHVAALQRQQTLSASEAYCSVPTFSMMVPPEQPPMYSSAAPPHFLSVPPVSSGGGINFPLPPPHNLLQQNQHVSSIRKPPVQEDDDDDYD